MTPLVHRRKTESRRKKQRSSLNGRYFPYIKNGSADGYPALPLS
ncbi:hypothetical protein HMPREF3039_01500 [Akkermansia sp. KLE1798]|nr:hypothetical protein HMPREF3039_01500 [Akkermansia sp. KLE1798]KZA04703.1 hypothetical protein HMPREF1326_01578 [Akkermansia sp. KLE1605]